MKITLQDFEKALIAIGNPESKVISSAVQHHQYSYDTVKAIVEYFLEQYAKEAVQKQEYKNSEELWDNNSRSIPEHFEGELGDIIQDYPEINFIVGKSVMLKEDFFEAVQQSREGEVDWEAKYKKCIDVIKKFDPGIIGMYDL